MAFITELIEGYADMTAEEKLAALEALEQPQADTSEVEKYKNAFNKSSHELAELKKANKALEEEKKSKMTEDELAEAERQELLKELKDENENLKDENENLKREKAVSEAKAQYIALGYSEELAAKTANALYEGDTASVIEAAKTYRKTLEQSIRKDITKGNPTPDSKGNPGKPVTRADILAVKDTAERQRLISENIELFESN